MKCPKVIDKDSLAIASTSLASQLIGTVFSFYYLKVFLNLYHLDTFWLNVSQVLFMIWNAVNDPIFGYMQDVGFCGMKWLMNRRKVILYGGPFYVLFFMLFWIPWIQDDELNDSADQIQQQNSAMVGANFTKPGDNAWIIGVHLTVALFLYDALLSLVLSAQCGLFTELTTKHTGRVRVVIYMEMASSLGTLCIFPVDAISKSATNFSAFQMCCLVVACVALVFFSLTGFLATDDIAQVTNSNHLKHHQNNQQLKRQDSSNE